MLLTGGVAPADDLGVATNAEARASTVRMIAGLSRYTYEMLTGRAATNGEPRCIPKNPQGEYGIDLSGPPYGSAVLHPLWTMGGMVASADVVGEKTCAIITSTASKAFAAKFWVRPFCQYASAPYSRGYFAGLGACTALTNRAFTVKLFTTGNGAAFRTQSYTAATTADQAFDVGGAWVDLVPGWNSVTILCETASAGVSISGMSINQIVKRRHTFP